MTTQDPEQKPTTKEQVNTRSFWESRVAWHLIQMITRIQVGDEALDSFALLDAQLLHTSVIIYAYHSSVIDGLILPIAIRHHLKNLNEIMGPIAITHYQGVEKIVMQAVGHISGTQLYPVVRKKDVKKYGEAAQAQYREALVEATQNTLARVGNIYGIAPAGTRKKVITPNDINTSFLSIAHKHQTPLTPLAFFRNEKGRRQIVLGEPLDPPGQKIITNETIAFYLRALAATLPEGLVKTS